MTPDPVRDGLEQFHRDAELSLLVPIVMLCFLHARDLETRHAPVVAAAEALHDFCQQAADLNLWWSTAEQVDAKRAAERAVLAFAAAVGAREIAKVLMFCESRRPDDDGPTRAARGAGASVQGDTCGDPPQRSVQDAAGEAGLEPADSLCIYCSDRPVDPSHEPYCSPICAINAGTE